MLAGGEELGEDVREGRAAPVSEVPGEPTTTASQRTVAVGAWLLTVVSLAATAVLLAPVRRLDLASHVGSEVAVHEYVELLLGLTLATVGAVVVLRSNATTYGWLLLATGTTVSVAELAFEYALFAWYGAPERTLPFETAAIVVQDAWMVPFALLVLALPSLFPDGRAVPRWRNALRRLVWGWAALFLLYMLTSHPASNAFEGLDAGPTNPTALVTWRAPFEPIWALLTLASVVVSTGSIVSRWRGSDDVMRQRLKWMLYALVGSVTAVSVATLATAMFETAGLLAGLEEVRPLIMTTSWLAVAIAVGLGVLGYRLYDVDLVLNRTLVYGLMTTMVVIVYVGVVVGLGEMLPTAELGTSVLVTGLVAVAFEPVRRRVQRWVNRMMFGQRDDPIEVLTALGTVLERYAAPASALRDATETVAEALRVPGVAIDLFVDGSWQRHAAAGRLPRDAEVVPLVHAGEQVGRLVVGRRSPNDALHAADHRLLATVASQVAALARSVALALDLRRSREQLVQAREEERRRLRRDLHDGLGPSLASQTFTLDTVLDRLGDDVPEASRMLEELKRQNKDLVGEIRRLVHELRPPALDELGLVGALAAHAGGLARPGRLDVTVTADPDPMGTLPAAVEVAAYRIATEAVTNVIRHAAARACRIELRRGPAELTVRVEDDGIGIRQVSSPGVGLTSMRERAEELGGRCTVQQGREAGTVVLATIPFVDEDANEGRDATTDRRAVDHVG